MTDYSEMRERADTLPLADILKGLPPELVLLKPEEAAAILRCSASTLSKRKGKWATVPVRKHGGVNVYCLASLMAWSAAHEQNSPAPLLTPFQRAKQRVRSLRDEVPEIRPASKVEVG